MHCLTSNILIVLVIEDQQRWISRQMKEEGVVDNMIAEIEGVKREQRLGIDLPYCHYL